MPNLMVVIITAIKNNALDYKNPLSKIWAIKVLRKQL